MKNYEPYFIESISEVNEENKHYVFDVIPPRSETNGFYDEDWYYELHIKTINFTIDYNDFLQSYIHIEILDNETIEIYEGECYEDSCVSDPIKYELLELKKFEKALRLEWKEKSMNLRKDFNNLVNKKINVYKEIRNKVIENYQNIYNDSLSDLHFFDLTKETVTQPYLFKILYRLFNSNTGQDTLNKLIDPYYYNIKQSKSWKDDYDHLDTKFRNLKNVDISDYQIIRNHIIEIYERTYKHMMPSLLINYKNIDENKYQKYFESLMHQLKGTN